MRDERFWLFCLFRANSFAMMELAGFAIFSKDRRRSFAAKPHYLDSSQLLKNVKQPVQSKGPICVPSPPCWIVRSKPLDGVIVLTDLTVLCKQHIACLECEIPHVTRSLFRHWFTMGKTPLLSRVKLRRIPRLQRKLRFQSTDDFIPTQAPIPVHVTHTEPGFGVLGQRTSGNMWKQLTASVKVEDLKAAFSSNSGAQVWKLLLGPKSLQPSHVFPTVCGRYLHGFFCFHIYLSLFVVIFSYEIVSRSVYLVIFCVSEFSCVQIWIAREIQSTWGPGVRLANSSV